MRAFCSDSFEAGYPNWTANMPQHFRKYRGYDMTPYLPVLRGYFVGSDCGICRDSNWEVDSRSLR